MKTYLFTALAIFVLALPACKKSDTNDNNANNNTNNNNNNNNNPSDTTSGLLALVDTSSTSYAVFVVKGYQSNVLDTVVFQTANQDHVFYYGESGNSGKGYFIQFLSSSLTLKNPGKVISMGIEIKQSTGSDSLPSDCSYVDTLIRVGNYGTYNGQTYKPSVVVFFDSTNLNSQLQPNSSRFADQSFFKIEKMTEMPSIHNGCHKYRINGSFSKEVTLWNSTCGPIPALTIVSGIVQMDFDYY